ncbi:hypothetical protein D9M71_199060 [compost metagenome]
MFMAQAVGNVIEERQVQRFAVVMLNIDADFAGSPKCKAAGQLPLQTGRGQAPQQQGIDQAERGQCQEQAPGNGTAVGWHRQAQGLGSAEQK